MEFFTSAASTLQTLVIALGAGLVVWGVINLLEGYGSENPSANGEGAIRKQTEKPTDGNVKPLPCSIGRRFRIVLKMGVW